MSTIRFILNKILLVEVFLIVLFLANNMLGITIPVVSTIVDVLLVQLTPIAVISLVAYIVLCLISFKIAEIVFGIFLGIVILYYIFNY